MIRVIQSLSIFLLLATSLAVLLTFINLGFYAYPSADDFCMVSGVEQHGLFGNLWKHYFEWSGRYSGNAFYALYPLLFGFFHGYPLIAVLLIVSIFVASAFFISSLFRLKMMSPTVLVVALVFVCIYLLGLRHTASSLYWMAGALSYQTANILMLFTLGLILKLMDRQKAQESILSVYLWLVFVVVLGMGANETNMITLLGVLGLMFVLHLRSGWSRLKPWAGLLAIGLVCFSIVYFAPGNTLRESTFPYRHDWVRSLQGSWNMGSWTLVAWTLNPVFIVASLLLPFAVARLVQLSPRKISIPWGVILFLLFVTLAAPFVLQFPAWWSMGGWPPPRTVDAIFFVYLMSWSLLLGALIMRFMPRFLLLSNNNQPVQKVEISLLMLVLVFMLSIGLSSKFKRALNDLWNRAETFEAYMLDRHARIYDALEKQQGFVSVPAYNQEYPRSIYFNDIRVDARDWRNVCYAQYFGLQGIALDPGVKAGN